MVENRCLGPPVQHAGLERLYLPREVVSFGDEAVDRVVGRGQMESSGPRRSDRSGSRRERQRSARPPVAHGGVTRVGARHGADVSSRDAAATRRAPPCVLTRGLTRRPPTPIGRAPSSAVIAAAAAKRVVPSRQAAAHRLPSDPTQSSGVPFECQSPRASRSSAGVRGPRAGGGRSCAGATSCCGGSCAPASCRAARSRALRDRGLRSISSAVGRRGCGPTGARRGDRPQTHTGDFGRTRAAAALGGDEALHDAVLQRVIADDREAAAVAQHVDGRLKRYRQSLEFAVDRDAQRLEDARRRVDATAAARRRGRGARPRCRRAACRSRLAPCVVRSTIARAMRRACGSSPYWRNRSVSCCSSSSAISCAGRNAARGVEAHVERTLGAKAERALVVGQLVRAEAEVEQHPIGRNEARFGRRVGEVLEVRLAERHSVAIPRQSFAVLAMAAASASRPSNRPSGLAASRTRTECPPPPTVASIWRLPGAGARDSNTSCTITGKCPSSISTAVGDGPTDPGGSFGALDAEVGDVRGEGIGRVHLRAVGGPASRAPTARCDCASQPPPLRFGAARTRAGPVGRTRRPWASSWTSNAPEKRNREKTRAPASETGRSPTRSANLLPRLLREDGQAGVDPAAHECPGCELGPKARRDGHPPLGVDCVAVLAGEQAATSGPVLPRLNDGGRVHHRRPCASAGRDTFHPISPL